MTDPVIPQLTPGDKNKMALLNSASQPVLGMFFKPFIFEPAKLQPGETGAVAATDTLHPYAYTPIRPYLDTRTFRHRMSSYIVNGFDLTNAANKLVVAPGKMKVFLSAKDTVGDSYIDVDYPGNTIDVSSFGAVPYNFPLPVIAHITTNGVNSLSVTVKVGVLKAEAFTPYKEYITLGTILVSPSNIISIITSGLDWKPSSTKIQDIIAAVSPMQHNIIPVLDDKKFGVKVKLGDHASIYDRSVIPHDENFKHNQWKPASQLRLTVLDSNGGYVNQAIASPTECVNAGKLQDTLRNGSPSGMATGQFALHPLFYTAQVDVHGNPVEGVLYMQLAQTVYNKPIGSQGLFFVEEYMLDESLGNFQRCDVVENTAAFIGFFVCGEGVTTIGDCDVIVASDGFSKSFIDPAPLPPENGIEDSYVTYHDGDYHADGVQEPPIGAILGTDSFGTIEPALDFGANYYQFKLRVIFNGALVDGHRTKVGANTEIELFNKKYPHGIKSSVAGSDAAKLKERISFVYGLNSSDGSGGDRVGMSSIVGRAYSQVYVRALGIDFRAGEEDVCLALLWGVDDNFLLNELQKKIMPVFFNFNIKISRATSRVFLRGFPVEWGEYGITGGNISEYSFIEDASLLMDAVAGDESFGYVNRFGENSGDYCMNLFAPKLTKLLPDFEVNTPGYFSAGMHHSTAYDAAIRASYKYPTPSTIFKSLGFSSPAVDAEAAVSFMTAPGVGTYIPANPNINVAKVLTADRKTLKTTIINRANKYILTPRYDQLTENPIVLPDALKSISTQGIRSPAMENYSKQYVDRLLIVVSVLCYSNDNSPIKDSMVSFNCMTGNDDKGLSGNSIYNLNEPTTCDFVYELEGGGYIP